MLCIAHIDLDCFYAQVEAVRLGINCRVTPYALIQWGNLIAVNYPARDKGVRRFHDTPATALEKVPDLVTSHIATYRMGDPAIEYPENPPPRIATHKVALEVYREASSKIFVILRSHAGVTVGKAGIDEAYLDVTEAARVELAALRAGRAADAPPLTPEEALEPSTRLIMDRAAEMEAWLAERGASLATAYELPMCALKRGEAGEVACALEGSRCYSVGGAAAATAGERTAHAENSLLLCAASRVVRRIRDAIHAELHYDCSAGIAHNRLLAKCISATHKPNQQTLLFPDRAASALFDLKISELRGFGGKFGKAVQAVCGGVELCREAWLVPMEQLARLNDFTFSSADLSDEPLEEGGAAAAKESTTKQGTLGVYTYYRLRGLGNDDVADPALPHAFNSSKVFHTYCRSLRDVGQWMVVLAAELCARFDGYTPAYVPSGRVLTTRLHTRRADGSGRTFKRQSPLPDSDPLDPSEVAAIATRSAEKLAVELRQELAAKARAGAGAGTAKMNEDALPPLRFIEISINLLKLRGGKGDPAASGNDAAQPTLLSMFSSLSARAPAQDIQQQQHQSTRGGEHETGSDGSDRQGSNADSVDDDSVIVEDNRTAGNASSSSTRAGEARRDVVECLPTAPKRSRQLTVLDFMMMGNKKNRAVAPPTMVIASSSSDDEALGYA